MDTEQFWLAEYLYDDDKIFINSDHIISIRPIMDDDTITGYSILTVDDESYEVKFKTGPFSYTYGVMQKIKQSEISFKK